VISFTRVTFLLTRISWQAVHPWRSRNAPTCLWSYFVAREAGRRIGLRIQWNRMLAAQSRPHNRGRRIEKATGCAKRP